MQRTTNYGLCQYEGSDKTSYLVNYNEDMLKIDTAIKNAADAGSGAGTAAERAQGTADGAAEAVSTLNTQINGDNGLATDVNTLQGSVGSINSLIGNGTPTTSDQTIIGAINGLEGAIAPREDAVNFANSYLIGEQFARGGSVFTALTPITAGTAFVSLTLNTDYKVSDTIVEQISDSAANITTINNNIKNKYMIRGERVIVSVTADGVKTVSALLDELHAALQSAVSSFPDGVSVQPLYVTIFNYADCKFEDVVSLNNQSVLGLLAVSAIGYNESANRFIIQNANIKASDSKTMGVYVDTTNATITVVTGIDNTVPTSGYQFKIIGNIFDVVPSI